MREREREREREGEREREKRERERERERERVHAVLWPCVLHVCVLCLCVGICSVCLCAHSPPKRYICNQRMLSCIQIPKRKRWCYPPFPRQLVTRREATSSRKPCKLCPIKPRAAAAAAETAGGEEVHFSS